MNDNDSRYYSGQPNGPSRRRTSPSADPARRPARSQRPSGEEDLRAQGASRRNRVSTGSTGQFRSASQGTGSGRPVSQATGSSRPVSRDGSSTGRIPASQDRRRSAQRDSYAGNYSRSGRRYNSAGAPRGNREDNRTSPSRAPRNSGSDDLFTIIMNFLKAAVAAIGGFLSAVARKSKVALAAIIVVALVILGGAVDSLASVGKVHSRVMVGDIKARGMTEEELAQAIQSEYEPLISASDVTIYRSEDAMNEQAENPVDSGNLSVEEQAAQTNYWTANWETMQAHIDYESLAHEAFEAGRGGPLDRLGVLFFGKKIDVSVQFNEAALESLASNIDLALGESFTNSELVIENGTARATESASGMMVDRKELQQKLSEQFTSKDVQNRQFFETVVETDPQISTEEGQKAADKVNSAIANGAKFTYNDTSWSADSAELGSWVGTYIVTDDKGESSLVVYFDPKLATPDISEHAKAVFPDGNEGVRFEDKGNGEIVVKLDSEGTMPQINSSISKLNDQLFGDGANTTSAPTIEVESVQVPSEMSFNEALNANVIGLISEYTTEFTAGAAERNHNIRLAGEKINNSIVEADGGIWSFHDTVGESNAENGFQSAGSIVAGEMSEEIGGGICLVATTVFNAVYDAGLPVVERRNHTMYISSYPEGRDAAVSWPDLDLKWENDTSSDILVKTSSTETSLTVCLYGISPGYTVETQTGEWTDSTDYEKVVKYDSELAPGTSYVKTTGSNGHTIQVIRTVKDKEGKKVREDTFVSVYEPTDEVTVRGGTPSDWPSDNS